MMENKLKIASGLIFLLSSLFFSCNPKAERIDDSSSTNNKKENKDTVALLAPYTPKSDSFIQTFQINPNKKQKIKGKQGTVITIPAGCFGKEDQNIKIEMIECYSIQDMLLNGLSTQTANGKLLETDGMIYLNAMNEEGDTLAIKEREVRVEMPTKNRKEDIHIFEGEQKNGHIVWNLSNETLIIKDSKEQEIKGNPNTKGEMVDAEEPTSDSLPSDFYEIKRDTITFDKSVAGDRIINYVFNISNLGWINCDRFMDGDSKKIHVNIHKNELNATLYLILNNYNSFMIPLYQIPRDGKFEFLNIPLSESFTLLALGTKGEQVYFGMSDYNSTEEIFNYPELEPVTRQDLTSQLLEKFGKDIWNRPKI